MPLTRQEDGRSRRARERRESTHEALLEASRQAFASEGYGHASPEYIARLAGVSRATFYQHFDTKADAFAAIFDEVLVRLDKAVLGVELRPEDESPEMQLIGNLLRVRRVSILRPGRITPGTYKAFLDHCQAIDNVESRRIRVSE